MKTAIVILTWNRVEKLKKTIMSFLHFNKVLAKNIIIVDNGSQDGTVDFINKSNFPNVLFNKKNFGAQIGKRQGWDLAKSQGYEYILFIEDDFPCINTIPFVSLENYLISHPEVGYIRLNDKKYLRKHVISKKKINYQNWENLIDDFYIRKSDYNFSTNPAMFRVSLLKYFLKEAKHEKEYMRWYMDAYKYQAQIKPYCFKTVIAPRINGWKR